MLRKKQYKDLNSQFYSSRKERKQYELLSEAICPCKNFSYFDEVYDEDGAKKALIGFFQNLEKIKPSKILNTGFREEYYSFFINLMLFYDALSNGKYCIACHELLSLYHYEPILQERIYYNLLLLYREYLE